MRPFPSANGWMVSNCRWAHTAPGSPVSRSRPEKISPIRAVPDDHVDRPVSPALGVALPPHHPPVQLQQSPLPVGTAQDPSQRLGVGLYPVLPALPLDVGRGPRLPPDHGR